MIVHDAPPTKCMKASGHNLLAAIATISRIEHDRQGRSALARDDLKVRPLDPAGGGPLGAEAPDRDRCARHDAKKISPVEAVY